MKSRTRILVTHHVGLCIRSAAFVVAMKDGQIVGQGPADQILSSGVLGDICVEEENKEDNGVKNDNDDDEDAKKRINTCDKDGNTGDGKLVAEEKREEGAVKLAVHKSYLMA